MSGWENAGSRSSSLPPALIGLDEFQLAIPWRGSLHQSPPPLHQPGPVCGKLASLVEDFSANGKVSLNWLSHPRGQVQRTVSSAEVVFDYLWQHVHNGKDRLFVVPFDKEQDYKSKNAITLLKDL